ncbi:MAG: T9SS type A sorting domain-containing protein [Prolixibacteraceae bacterium]
MRTSIFLLLLFSLSLLKAQTNGQASECNAGFVFEVNTQIMSFVPATALNFYDNSKGEVIEWYWDFGDETTSNEQNPLHVYVWPFANDSMKVMDNPFRIVSLTIITADGCKSNFVQTINIYDPVPADVNACRAGFKYYELAFDSTTKITTFQFRNYSEGDSLHYEWKFGDGYSSTEAEPQFSFDFSQPERKVCLKVTSPNGCTDTFCDAVWINQGGGSIDPVDTLYNNCFSAFKYDVNYDVQTFAPAIVLNFYSKVDGIPAKYYWDFGDGTYSEEANPVHIFNLPIAGDTLVNDVYPYRKVCLTTTTMEGCISSYCEDINIYSVDPAVDACDASFKYYPHDQIMTIPDQLPYQFYATGQNIVDWTWYFDDGTVSHEAEPIAYFDVNQPMQQVCLTIRTADSCINKSCETIYLNTGAVDTIYPDPATCGYSFTYEADFPITASACLGTVSAQVVFGDSLIEADYYYWITPDGQMVEGQELTHLCPTQTYMVTALTYDGCKFSESFVFNANGTVTVLPLNWWMQNKGDDTYIEYEVPDSSYYVEWILCDGSVVSDTSILLSLINCGSDQPNMVMRDASGNVVFSEIVGNKTEVNSLHDSHLLIFPNPVHNMLNINYEGMSMQPTGFEILSLKGEQLLQSKSQSDLTTIDVSTLKKGIYLIKIYFAGGRIISQRFCK